MLRSEINSIRNPIEKAATDPLHCDAAVLMGIARDILGKVGKDYPSDEGFLQPTTTERGVLCDVAQVLLGDECQHSRVSWRMRGAQTALSTMDRLVRPEPEKRPITGETTRNSVEAYIRTTGAGYCEDEHGALVLSDRKQDKDKVVSGNPDVPYTRIWRDCRGWNWRTQYDTGNLDSFELLDELIKEQRGS